MTEITDSDSDESDEHLGGRRIPAPYLDAQFETEIIDGQINGYNGDIAEKLAPTIELGCGERHIFLQPKAGKQRDRENDTKGRDMRSDCLSKLDIGYCKL